MITSMKNVNKQKFSLRMLLSIVFDFFAIFSLVLIIKPLLMKKRVNQHDIPFVHCPKH